MRLHIAIAATAVLIVGCAVAPPVIDLSSSAYRVSSETTAARKPVTRIEIRNSVKDDVQQSFNTTLGAENLIPIRPATTTKQTVEADLQSFFSAALVVDNSAKRAVSVTIAKADSYWVLGRAATVPLVGIAFAGADTEFGMNIRVLMEVEEDGKVISSYQFDEKITTQDKSSTGEAIQASYQRLVAAYRKRMFADLETRFVRRYL